MLTISEYTCIHFIFLAGHSIVFCCTFGIYTVLLLCMEQDQRACCLAVVYIHITVSSRLNVGSLQFFVVNHIVYLFFTFDLVYPDVFMLYIPLLVWLS